jgi:O-antigen/teichoic acid export membrane protein
MRSLISGSGIYLASNICVAAISFALVPVLTRFLGPSEYGQVAMFQVLVGAVTALTGFSVLGSATRKCYDDGVTRPELAQFVGTCVQVLVVSSMLLFAATYLFRDAIGHRLGLDVSWVLGAVPVAACNFLVNLRLGQWQATGMARKYGQLQVAVALATALLSLLLVVVLLQGARGAITSQVYLTPVFGILALYLLQREGLLQLSWRPDLAREALAFGIPLVPHVAGLFLLRAADRFVINARLGLDDAGIYMVAVQLTLAMAIVFDAINKAFVPWLFERLSRGDPGEKAMVVRLTYRYFALALATAGIAFLLGPWVVRLVAGPGFEHAGPLVGWLALGQAFAGMYLMVTNYVFFSKKTGLLSLATISSGMLNVLLLLLLVPAFGLVGAAWAFTTSMAARFLLVWVIAQRRHPMPWFPWTGRRT